MLYSPKSQNLTNIHGRRQGRWDICTLRSLKNSVCKKVPLKFWLVLLAFALITLKFNLKILPSMRRNGLC